MKKNSDLIKDFMKKHNLTKKEMAKRCNVSVYILNRLLSGFCDIDIEKFYNVVSYTNISSDDLLYI